MELPVFDRTISGRGVLEIPDEYRKALDIFLYTQLLRPNRTEYLNVAYNPGRKFLANLTFCIDEYVYAEYAINYDKQVFQIFDGQSSQNLLSLICSHDDVLNSIANVAIGLGIFLSRNNSIKEHSYRTFVPNRIRFVCYGTTALQISLRGNGFSQCNPEDGSPTPPPPKPVPVPPLPPEEPVIVSPPYDGGNDGGDTVPAPIDDIEGGVANRCRVIYDYTDFANPAGSLADQQSAEFDVVTPANITGVTYFDDDGGSNPPGTPRSSDAIVVGDDGVSQNVPLIRNGVNGHSVSNLRLACNN